MADYREAYCPHCNKKLISKYRVDSSKQVTHGYCIAMKCGKKYRVEHGDGKINVYKE